MPAVDSFAIESAKGELPGSGNSHWVADAFLLSTAVMWGVNIPVVKDAISRLDPFLFNASRLLFSAFALGLCAWLEIRSGRRQTNALPWQQVFIFASLTGLIYQVLFILGITRTTAGNTALLLATMPVWTAILSFAFYRERLPAITWAGLAITLSGTVVVIAGGGKVSFSGEFLLGNFFMLFAAMTWAAATVYSRPLMRSVSPLKLAFLASVMTVPIHWVIAPIMMNFATREYEPWSEVLFRWPIVIALVYSGAFSTGIAYATWNIGVRQVGGSHAAVYQNVVSLVAVLGGWIFLREPVLAAQIVGGVFIVAGLLFMRRTR